MLQQILSRFDLSQEKINEITHLEYLPITTSRGNLQGKIFSHLTVLGKGPSYVSPGGHRQSQWWCLCDCKEHNIILVRSSNLTSSNTKSCGCQNNKSRKENIKKATEACKIDLYNKQFGECLAIKPTDERKGNSVVWECKCSCGKTFYAAANEINADRIQSCGCIMESHGIRKIKKILDDNNIPYITEKTYSSCKFPDTKASARFDFLINNDFLLEYDGVQHFKEVDNSYFRDTLEKRQYHDNYKNQWCKENNIKLKRIPYTELNNLSLEMIMGDTYLL